jgi:hypothetical protein
MSLLKEKSSYVYLLFSAIILLPIVTFPISSDLSVFMHGGLVIANGGELFKDFFDIKPPLLYYIFAGLNYVFGDNVLVFRIFDFIYQMSFLFLSIVLFRKMGVKEKVIKAFLILFPLSYTILNYRDILQVESLAFLPLLIYFYFLIKKDYKPKTVLILGLMLGLCISLKYTMGIIFLASIPLFVKSYQNKMKTIVFLSVQLAIALLVLLITVSPIILQGNIAGFWATNQYLAEYAKYPPLGTELFKEMIKSLAHNFGSMISVTYLFFCLLAAIFSVKKDKNEIYKYALLLCLLLFISVLIEKKINMYHVTRIYPFFMLLVSYGAIRFIKKFKFRWNLPSLVFISIFIFLSPLLRFVNTYKIAYNRVFNYPAYLSYYTNDKPFNILGHHIAIADYVNRLGDRKFLFINTGGNQTIHYLDFDYKYKFPHSAFHLSPKAPELYKKAFEEDLHDANIIAIDSSDDIYMIFLSEGSSYDLFFKNQEYKDYMKENFDLDTILLNRYFIYKRKTI